MTPTPTDRFVFLLATKSASVAEAVEQVLAEIGVPYETGVQSEPVPQVVFSVREADADRARTAVEQGFGTGPLAQEEEEAQAPETRKVGTAAFPLGPAVAAGAVVLLHLAILLALVGRDPGSERLAEVGGLVAGAPPGELWRLVTSLFLHADLPHVLWNGLSMTVFAVPLVDRIGWAKCAATYLAGGLAGGIAALAASDPGTVIVGSSGAVAGLFGCWLILTIRRAREETLARRAVVRTVGIGLLVLPTLLSRATPGGHRVSIAAHLGGLAAGVMIGTALRESRSRTEAVSSGGRSPGVGPPLDPTSPS